MGAEDAARERPTTRRTGTKRPIRRRSSCRSARRSFAITCAASTILHAMLTKNGDWMLLGSADEQKPAADGTVEAWGRSSAQSGQGLVRPQEGAARALRDVRPAGARGARPRGGRAQPEEQPDARGRQEAMMTRRLVGCRVTERRPPSPTRASSSWRWSTACAPSCIATARASPARSSRARTSSRTRSPRRSTRLSLSPEVPPLRPWLFRIAHNAAIDFLKSHGRKYTDAARGARRRRGLRGQARSAVVRAALARFLSLPVTQRSAVILKDVLGHSLEETAETMGTTVMAVKAALVRGRGRLLASESATRPRSRPTTRADARSLREPLQRARLGRRARARQRRLPARSRLQVAAPRQAGRHVLRPLREGGRRAPRRAPRRAARARGVRRAARRSPAYFILLEFEDGRVTSIRDFRYVPYIAAEAEFEIVAMATAGPAG